MLKPVERQDSNVIEITSQKPKITELLEKFGLSTNEQNQDTKYIGRILIEDEFSDDFKLIIASGIQHFNSQEATGATYLTVCDEETGEIWVEWCSPQASEFVKCDPKNFGTVLQQGALNQINPTDNLFEGIDLSTQEGKTTARRNNFTEAKASAKGTTERIYQIKTPNGDDIYIKDTAEISSLKNFKISKGSITPETVQMLELNKLQERTKTLEETMRDLRKMFVKQNKIVAELEERTRELETKSTTDALTEIANRRFFDEFVKQGIEQAKRNSNPLFLILLDIDKFKKVNDTYGHPAGDEVLKRIAQKIKDTIRKEDLVARYGGEEFVVMGSAKSSDKRTGLEAGAILAEKIRQAIEDMNFSDIFRDGRKTVTTSLGVSAFEPKSDKTNKTDNTDEKTPDIIEELTTTADLNLYMAKGSGRNTVSCGLDDCKEKETKGKRFFSKSIQLIKKLLKNN